MTIRGQKTILRPIRLDDAPRFLKWLKDEEVSKNLGYEVEPSLKGERKWIRGLEKRRKTDLQFAIDTKEGVHIGSIGGKINLKNSYFELGILIGDKNYWGKGYGTEAMKLIMDHIFKTLKVHRIELEVISYNERAVSLYKDLGFTQEGIMRSRHLYGGKYYDEYKMGILREKWSSKK